MAFAIDGSNLQRVLLEIVFQGEGVERLLVKGKKPEQVEEIDGDDFRYYLLAGTKSFLVFGVINKC